MPKELERTFLLKFIPDLSRCKNSEIIDVYIPKTRAHPVLRIRKNGGSLEITKKEPLDGKDSSKQFEHTIRLDEGEFTALSAAGGKKLHKIRYYYEYNGKTLEIDVMQGALKGLVMVDAEFSSEKEMNAFKMPGFCLAEVTQEKFAAGGMLCGKSYKNIEKDLKRFGYRRLK